MSTSSRDRFILDSKVSHETLIRFENFARLLVEWNARINLVSPATLPDLWVRHFMDSAQVMMYMPEGVHRLVDLGSGAGFPATVLGLMGVPEVHLIESDQRKCAFLREVSRVTDSDNTIIHAKRIEQVESLQADVVTARALASLEKLIPMALHHLRAGGSCLFLKGAGADEEITAARKRFDFTCETFRSTTSADGVVLRLSGIKVKT